MPSRHFFPVVRALALAALCSWSLAVHAQQDEEEGFEFNLNNADIQTLIKTVSVQTGRNFVVDPRVKARVTVISAKKLNAEEIYEAFLSVLQVHGFSAVPQGDLVKIVPDVNAKQGPVPAFNDTARTSDQLVTQVIKVENVPAAQLVPILRPLVPQQGHLAAYAATNTLIVTDRAANIDRLTDIIKGIDRPDNDEVEVVRVNHASAAEVIRILQSLQSRTAQAGGTGEVRFAADERTNSILLSGDTNTRVRMRSLIKNLDTPVESGGNTRVVYLRYANAEDLLPILTGVSAGQAQVGTAAAESDAAGGAAQQQGNIPQPTVDANGSPIPQTPTASIIRRPNDQQASSGPNIDIQADADTNALIITAPSDEMRSILAVIDQLDIRRAQVLVEAIIAELSENNTNALGVNFAVDGSQGDRPVAVTNLGGATAAAVASVASGGAILPGGLSLALGQAGNDTNFGVLISAIASNSDNNILSTPTLVTMDNQEAEIVVGQNVPFVTGTQLSTGNDNPFQTIERQDIGISLKVTPQINEGNNIKMDIEQEVSDLSNTAVAGASDIITNQRSIKTTVLVEDGQTLVLGGLIDDQINNTSEKVPFLGDIPLLGKLFQFNTASKIKRNLMVFLHPTILRNPEDSENISRSKYEELRSAQLGTFGEEALINRPAPRLPELHMFFDGKRVDSQSDTLRTLVPSSSIDNTPAGEPALNTSALPSIQVVPVQASASGANNELPGPFDEID